MVSAYDRRFLLWRMARHQKTNTFRHSNGRAVCYRHSSQSHNNPPASGFDRMIEVIEQAAADDKYSYDGSRRWATASRSWREFREHYNLQRLHSALADLTTTAFAPLHWAKPSPLIRRALRAS
jgi:hypothetical protein